MNITYIATDKKQSYYVARNYMDNYRCTDYIAPVSRDYFGKKGASSALMFQSPEEAKEFINHSGRLIPNDWIVSKYDTCANKILEEVKA